MHWLVALNEPLWVKDACGYLASGLVLSTFSVTSMRRLRLLGIGSNVAFICYAVMAGMLPILVLHVLLLPVNVLRLVQFEREQRPAT